MNKFAEALKIIMVLLALNITALADIAGFSHPFLTVGFAVAVGVIMLVYNIAPSFKNSGTFRLVALHGGCLLLSACLWVTLAQLALLPLYIKLMLGGRLSPWAFYFTLGFVLLQVLIMLVNGSVRITVASRQAGVINRILFISFWWMPLLNLFLLLKMYREAKFECESEILRHKLNTVRKESEVCMTKYPLLLVHGVFFRDSRYFNYWGRIPAELERNGATVYYGNQESALPVKESAAQLASRIKQIVEETGCEKVNIIAHSKGGLDSRYAIAHLGCNKYVASLTTISTPHRGCVFADNLLAKLPHGLVNFIAGRYNKAFTLLGDKNPDFLNTVYDLTAEKCKKMNVDTPDAEGVLYQSAATKMKRPSSAPFPLSLSYRLISRCEGANDGLVAESSAKWGQWLGTTAIKNKKGISHGDAIDLTRKTLRGFDVLEYYVDIVKNLKQKGY